MDLSREKEKLFQKPNFMASFVEGSKMIDLKTLSDGLKGSLENISDKEEEYEDELLEVPDIIDEDDDDDSIKNYPDPDPTIKEESETQIDYEFPPSERSESSETNDEELRVAQFWGQMSGK